MPDRHRPKTRRRALRLLRHALPCVVLVLSCGEGDAGGPRLPADARDVFDGVEPCAPDHSAAIPARPRVGSWLPVELEGTHCSDGSPYKFFVSYSGNSNDLAVMFEPGGACWDYEGCTGQGPRGAANPAGIPDDHMETWGLAYPLWADLPLEEGDDGTPLNFAREWNRVFLPYCTGDVFAGNLTRTYTSADGEDSIEYRHVGRKNLERVAEWLDAEFQTVPRLLVGGCSAGGAGALINYHLLREGIQGVQCGYLVSDSGPIFPAGGPSDPLQETIREAWNTEAIFASLEPLAEEILGAGAGELLFDDPGAMSELLAVAHPQDRLALTVYRWDFNYSLYSYDTFYDMPSDARIHDLWGQELDALVAQYDLYPNLAYYIAHARPDNCSHCLSIVPLDHLEEALAGQPYLGTEIEEADVDLHDFYLEVLDNPRPLPSYREQNPPEGEGLSPAQTEACR